MALLRHWWLKASLRYGAIVALSYWVAWLLRFDLSIPRSEHANFYSGLAIVMGVKMAINAGIGFRLERGWHSQSFSELTQLLRQNVVASAATGIIILWVDGSLFPRSIYILDPVICFLVSGGARFLVRLNKEWHLTRANDQEHKRILIYGAGVAGLALAKEVRENPALGYRVLGFLDDDPRKVGHQFMGLSVLGSGERAGAIVDQFKKRGQAVDEIVVAMPSATGHQIRAALAKGKATGVQSKIVPGLGELISGKLSVSKSQDISVTDLLGREPVEVDLNGVRPSVIGRVVMVTGAAGSIGSELCNQLGRLEPKCLIALDQAESPLFALEADLRKKYPNLNLVAEVGDIRDSRHIEAVVERHKVASVFHAAAYKHVPLMERQICEAVRNNVLGTWNLLQAARRSGVSTFVLISTDKAVNPSSIMGLTKRVAELLVSARSAHASAGCRFLSVRFGNVLISNGSVVPIFERQIAAGGPVTVTHPDMRRYFMTVQEAVHLVLHASAMSKGLETFVLDMGSPVRILDLATRMISLARFIPGEDIEIEFTGLRPGEKLFEELSLGDEDTVPTTHSRIRALKSRQHEFYEVAPWVAKLQSLLSRRDAEALVEHLIGLVPEYQPNPKATEPTKPIPVQHAIAASASAGAGQRLPA